MDSEEIAVCTFFGIFFGFFAIVAVIIAINEECNREADLKAMEMGYEQVVVDNQKVWRKVDNEN